MSDIAGKVTRWLVLGIQDWLDLVFAESQRIVPVRTGFLKRSGFFTRLRDGGTIGYRAPYAKKVEMGWEGGYEDVPGHFVRSHRRSLPHYKTRLSLYKAGAGPRPSRRWQKVQGYYVQAYRRFMPAYPGRHYLGKSVAKHMPRLGSVVGRRLVRESARR